MPASAGAAALLHPSRRPVSVTSRIPVRDVRVSHGGVQLRGWFFPSAIEPAGTVVHLHGSGDNRGSGLGIAERYTALGYDVLSYDSRAHGDSTGEACTYGFYEKSDLRRMLDEVSARPIVLFGNSLGAAVALQAAADDARIDGVIAVATFADLRSIAEERAPFFAGPRDIEQAFALAEAQARFEVDEVSPERSAARIRVPVMLIHGAQDQETLPAHSQRVHAALKGKKELVLVPGAGHTNVITPELWSRIDAFIASIKAPAEEPAPASAPAPVAQDVVPVPAPAPEPVKPSKPASGCKPDGTRGTRCDVDHPAEVLNPWQ